jgi:hypothetical protein
VDDDVGHEMGYRGVAAQLKAGFADLGHADQDGAAECRHALDE